MRPRIFYCAASRAAAAAAASLAGEFEVAPLTVGPGASCPGPSVVLVGAGAPAVPVAPTSRVIGLVDPGAAGPWPAAWYAVLPDGIGAPLLARAVRSAFDDLAAAAELGRLQGELSELNAIGLRLSAERDPDALLETILSKAREITVSDAGSLYLVEEDGGGARLRFVLAQNDSIEVTFRAAVLALTHDSVAGHVALTGEIVNLADAYAPAAGAPFRINRSFDEQAGYRTKSMLVVPMRTPQGETIGALQLINRKPSLLRRFASPAHIEREALAFEARHETLAASLASQAAVALDNSRLYESIRRLFEGFVQAAVVAIESRDPTTSGHSFRVARLAGRLAEIVDRCDSGPHRATRFTAEQMKQLRYASLLHDFGKVGVPEHVLVKAKKLLPAELERIRHRIELLGRDLELRAAFGKIEHLLLKGPGGYPEAAALLEAELAAARAQLGADFRLIESANEPTVLPAEAAAELAAVVARGIEDHRGARRAVLTPEEARVLSIARGSLTPAEYRQIQAHVLHTYEFLARIPWTRELQHVPAIAAAHHEKLDGSGYPHRLSGAAIPLPSRVIAIADIYDALTAADRPYKRAVPREQALDILEAERRAGAVDGPLLDLFLAGRAWEAAAAV